MREALGGEQAPPASLGELAASVAFAFLVHRINTVS
jgi:hypothetical protein